MSRKDPWYRQCTYETRIYGALLQGTSWIPEEFGRVGKKIRLKKHHRYPDAVWTVTEVGARQRESYLVERQLDYKHQRSMSDI